MSSLEGRDTNGERQRWEAKRKEQAERLTPGVHRKPAMLGSIRVPFGRGGEADCIIRLLRKLEPGKALTKQK